MMRKIGEAIEGAAGVHHHPNAAPDAATPATAGSQPPDWATSEHYPGEDAAGCRCPANSPASWPADLPQTGVGVCAGEANRIEARLYPDDTAPPPKAGARLLALLCHYLTCGLIMRPIKSPPHNPCLPVQTSAPPHASTGPASGKHHRLDLSKMSPRAQAIAAEVRACACMPAAGGLACRAFSGARRASPHNPLSAHP